MKILMLAYAFPPVAAAESFVAVKEMGQLAEEGITVDVISLNPQTSSVNFDSSLNEYIEGKFGSIWRVGMDPFILRLSQSFPRVVGRLSQFPDQFVFANKNVLKILKEIDLNKYDLLVTRSQWHSIHLVGLEIKKMHPQLPWISHFSDPWADNVLVKFNPISRLLCAKWEKAVVANSDAVTLTTEETIDLMFSKYPKEYRKKAFCIPHSYDEKLYDDGISKDNKKYIIRSLGAFYGAREPKPFFAAIDKILRENQHLMENVDVEFYGMHGRHRESLSRFEFARKRIKVFPNVSYVESLQLMKSAHCLLSIEAPMQHSVFFPSKLVDYMGAKSHILSISPSGAAARILNEVGATVANVHDSQDVFLKTRFVLEERPTLLNDYVTKYSSEMVKREFLKLVHSLMR